jgi:ribose transport system permease protein
MAKIEEDNKRSYFEQNREVVSLYIFVLLIIFIPALISPSFRSSQNITNVFNQIAPMGFIALGQTFAILTTGIDLSVGSVVSLTTALAATQMKMGDPVSIVITLGLIIASAVIIGAFNGLIISKLKLEPLIATLATGSIVQGITLTILAHPGGYVPRGFTQLWLYEIGGVVPLTFVYFLAVLGICYFILNHTIFGRRVYAMGGDEDKTRIAGISVDKFKVGVYTTSSVLASLSGLALAVRMRSGDPLSGAPFTLLSVAAVLVGGTTFSGGRGGVIRTTAGVFILGLLSVILNIFGVSPFYQNILSGSIIIVAVLYSSLRK